MWINDKVTYTSDVMQKVGEIKIEGTVVAVNADNGYLTLDTMDGILADIDPKQCTKEQIHD